MIFVMSNLATHIVTDKYSAHKSSNDLATLKLNLSEAEVDLFNIRQCTEHHGVLQFENSRYKECKIAAKKTPRSKND